MVTKLDNWRGTFRVDSNQLDLNDITKELSFLLLILRKGAPDEIVLNKYTVDLDWKLFMDLVQHHRVYPLVYLKFKELCITSIPPYIMESLYHLYYNNTIKMLNLSRELRRIYEAVSNSGIRMLVLKGPLLAVHLYNSLSHRTSKDLDLLVCTEDVEKVETILIHLGYKLKDKHILNNWKKTAHHLSFEHSEHQTQVEVHWRLNPYYSKSFSFDKLWDRKKNVVIANQAFYYLGNEDQLYYLTDHGARHGWFRLRWLLDIERLLPLINGGDMKVCFDQYGGRQYVGQALILLMQLISAKIPDELQQLTLNPKAYRLAVKALHYIKRIVRLNPVPEKSVARHYKRYLFSLMSGKQKIAYLLNKVLPNSRDALLLPLPKSLHFLYFPLRPFLWFWRYVFSKEPVNNG